ncbi:MAG: PQQ-binding-like beta-propeller repeat protein [Chloroflexota bacterium]
MHHRQSVDSQIEKFKRIYPSFIHLCYCLAFVTLLTTSCVSNNPLRRLTNNTPVVDAADKTLWLMEASGPDRDRAIEDDIPPPLNGVFEFKIGGETLHTSPVAVSENMLIAEGPRKLYALDLISGDTLWDFNVAGAFLSPAMDDTRVFIRAEAGTEGFLVALDSVAGEIQWIHQFPFVGSSGGNLGGHVTSPIVFGDLVIVGASSTLVAFDKNNGAEVWSFKADEAIASGAAIENNTVFFTDLLGAYALDLQTGQELWHYKHEILSLLFAPILTQDSVLITGGDTVFALEKTSGEAQWVRNFNDVPVIPAGATADTAYVKSTTELIALDLADGKRLWSFEALNFVSMPALTQDHAYVITRADGGSQLRGLQLSDGKEVWRLDDDQLANAAPVAAGGKIYVRSVNGVVYAYQP